MLWSAASRDSSAARRLPITLLPLELFELGLELRLASIALLFDLLEHAGRLFALTRQFGLLVFEPRVQLSVFHGPGAALLFERVASQPQFFLNATTVFG